MDKQKPAHEVRLGTIKATIWENVTRSGSFFNVTIHRLYKEGEEWKQATNFARNDLPLVAKVADQAHSWIFEQAAAAGG
ncbi:MAG: hypothetical protein K2R98_31580 [Gemmataceae bacterium]|nr:hypothetical protein [Gemmataceae bacterium]